MTKLTSGQTHMLRLAMKGAKEDGWAPVSKVVWPLLADIPTDLLEREQAEDGGGRARLTDTGAAVLLYV